MNEENKCYAATPPESLEEQIMSHCVAKNEREWWAQKEIISLRQQLSSFEKAACCPDEMGCKWRNEYKKILNLLDILETAMGVTILWLKQNNPQKALHCLELYRTMYEEGKTKDE